MISIRNFLLLSTALCVLTTTAQEALRTWSVKAILPNGSTLDVKAFDSDGSSHGVKALQRGDAHLLDIKAVVAGSELPMKVIASDDAFLPVKAITADGKLMDVKAIAPDGSKLDVKGVAWSGHILHIKAMGPDRALYGVKAISPEGRMHDVKGVKLSNGPEEGQVAGVPITAHIKAFPQAIAMDEDLIWNVKAIGADGHTIPVKAIDKNGGVHDVKAFMENGDRWIMDIKALIGGKKVAVKMLRSDDPLIPVKAVDADGAIHDIKALAADGRKLDVKGTLQDGNIIHLKAIDGGMELGIKAISDAGVQYDVKGLDLSTEGSGIQVRGAAMRAHVKAIPPLE